MELRAVHLPPLAGSDWESYGTEFSRRRRARDEPAGEPTQRTSCVDPVTGGDLDPAPTMKCRIRPCGTTTTKRAGTETFAVLGGFASFPW